MVDRIDDPIVRVPYSFDNDPLVTQSVRDFIATHPNKVLIEEYGPSEYLLDKFDLFSVSDADLELFSLLPSDSQCHILFCWCAVKFRDHPELLSFLIRIYRPDFADSIKVIIITRVIETFVLLPNILSEEALNWVMGKLSEISSRDAFASLTKNLVDVHLRVARVLAVLGENSGCVEDL